MKTRIITSVVISAAMLLAAPVFADEKVEWADVPPAVQKTITDHAAGGKRSTKSRRKPKPWMANR